MRNSKEGISIKNAIRRISRQVRQHEHGCIRVCVCCKCQSKVGRLLLRRPSLACRLSINGWKLIFAYFSRCECVCTPRIVVNTPASDGRTRKRIRTRSVNEKNPTSRTVINGIRSRMAASVFLCKYLRARISNDQKPNNSSAERRKKFPSSRFSSYRSLNSFYLIIMHI